MKALMNVLGNKNVNSVATGFIVAAGVIGFVSQVGGMLSAELLNSETSSGWIWNSFWDALIIFVLLMIAGWIVDSRAE